MIKFVGMRKSRGAGVRRECAPLIIIFALLCFLALIGAALGACEGAIADDKKAPSEDVLTVSGNDVMIYYQSLITFPRSGPSYPDKINNYIKEQAQILGLSAKTDKAGNLVVDAPATGGKDELSPVVLLAYTGADIACAPGTVFDPGVNGVSLSASEEQVRGEGTSMGARGALGTASILAALKVSENHGPVRAIFAAGTGDVKSDVAGGTGSDTDATSGAGSDTGATSGAGVSALDETGVSILREPGAGLAKEPESLILACSGDTGEVTEGAPMAAVLESKSSASAIAPEDGRAYVVAASGFKSAPVSTTEMGNYVNPISLITEILTEANNAGYHYELSSFTGGEDACVLPSEAKAVIVLGDYEERQLHKVVKLVTDRYSSALDPEGGGARVDIIETTRPAEAIDNSSVTNALTYLYGVLSLYQPGGEEAGAMMNMGEVDFSPSGLYCGTSVVGYPAGDSGDAVGAIVNDLLSFESISAIDIEVAREIPGYISSGPGSDERIKSRLNNAYKAALDGAGAGGVHVSAVLAERLSTLGVLPENILAQEIGVTIAQEGTPDEAFDKNIAALPANVILRYLEDT